MRGKWSGLQEKLHTSLEPAFPYSGRRDRAAKPEKNGPAEQTIVEHADHISTFAQTVCLRVYQFIHPEQYTVGLKELRHPSLLESLKSLQEWARDFKSAGKNKVNPGRDSLAGGPRNYWTASTGLV